MWKSRSGPRARSTARCPSRCGEGNEWLSRLLRRSAAIRPHGDISLIWIGSGWPMIGSKPTGRGSPATLLPTPGYNVTDDNTDDPRSEDHTSELQSLRHLVCRLLLEKKK